MSGWHKTHPAWLCSPNIISVSTGPTAVERTPQGQDSTITNHLPTSTEDPPLQTESKFPFHTLPLTFLSYVFIQVTTLFFMVLFFVWICAFCYSRRLAWVNLMHFYWEGWLPALPLLSSLQFIAPTFIIRLSGLGKTVCYSFLQFALPMSQYWVRFFKPLNTVLSTNTQLGTAVNIAQKNNDSAITLTKGVTQLCHFVTHNRMSKKH